VLQDVSGGGDVERSASFFERVKSEKKSLFFQEGARDQEGKVRRASKRLRWSRPGREKAAIEGF